MNLRDLRDVYDNSEAIFWFCYAWHNGRDDLYRAMVETDFDPDQHRTGRPDPHGLLILRDAYEKRIGPLVESPLWRVRLGDVVEGDVLASDPNKFACIMTGTRWPCRVHRWHGALGVHCVESHDTRYPGHQLTADAKGFVEGFKL